MKASEEILGRDHGATIDFKRSIVGLFLTSDFDAFMADIASQLAQTSQIRYRPRSTVAASDLATCALVLYNSFLYCESAQTRETVQGPREDVFGKQAFKTRLACAFLSLSLMYNAQLKEACVTMLELGHTFKLGNRSMREMAIRDRRQLERACVKAELKDEAISLSAFITEEPIMP